MPLCDTLCRFDLIIYEDNICMRMGFVSRTMKAYTGVEEYRFSG